MPNGFRADVAVLLLVGSIGTLFVPVAHETVVDAATVVRAFEVEVLLAVLNLHFTSDRSGQYASLLHLAVSEKLIQ